jgi:hypothetical protein
MLAGAIVKSERFLDWQLAGLTVMTLLRFPE